MNEKLIQIKTLLESGHIGAAKDGIKKFETELAAEPLYWLYCGIIHFGEQKFQEAVRCFDQSISLDETLIASHKNRAICLYYLGDEEAFKALCIAAWLDPLDTKLLELVLENFRCNLGFTDTFDIVLYTGTPWLQVDLNPKALNSALGGSETAFILMAQQLAKKGFKVACFCNTPFAQNYDGIHYYPVDRFFLYAYQKRIPVLIALRFAHPFGKQIKADKKILWIQETFGCATDDPIKPVLDEIDAICALSDYQIQQTAQHHQISSNKFYKTRNGFIEDLYTENSQIRTPYSLCYISRPERGLKEAILVSERLRNKFPDLKLHICNYTQWNNLASDPFLEPVIPLLKSGSVVYHGGLSKKEVAQLLSRCELMLYPNISDKETSCIAAIEAQAAGTPVITSDRGALPETVKHGIGGIIVPFSEGPEILESLEAEISKLFNNRHLIESLSKSAKLRAAQSYPWSFIADEWINHFKFTPS